MQQILRQNESCLIESSFMLIYISNKPEHSGQDFDDRLRVAAALPLRQWSEREWGAQKVNGTGIVAGVCFCFSDDRSSCSGI